MSRSSNRRSWLGSLALVPGAALAILPSATCPFCVAAYAGVLSSLGLGFLHNQRVLFPLIIGFLALGLATVAWSTRSHRRPGPLVATVAGTLAVLAGRMLWSVPAVLYVGIALLVGASCWNLWLKRPQPQPLTQLRLGRNQGAPLS